MLAACALAFAMADAIQLTGADKPEGRGQKRTRASLEDPLDRAQRLREFGMERHKVLFLLLQYARELDELIFKKKKSLLRNATGRLSLETDLPTELRNGACRLSREADLSTEAQGLRLPKSERVGPDAPAEMRQPGSNKHPSSLTSWAF